MEKSTASEFNRQLGNKFRRSLKEVQLSANEEKLVGSNMISPDDKTLHKVKQSKTGEKGVVAEKENVLTVRRSKRKIAAEKLTYVESPVNLKPSKPRNTQTKKTATKSKKNRPVTSKKNEEKTALNQTNLNFCPAKTDAVIENPCTSQPDNNLEKKVTGSSEVNEDSGFDPTCGISDQSPMNSTAISRSSNVESSSAIPYNMISAITADSPPLHYWRDLAEQRQMALEKALHENELLYDELSVLEAENSQLKQLLKEAENLAQVLRAVID